MPRTPEQVAHDELLRRSGPWGLVQVGATQRTLNMWSPPPSDELAEWEQWLGRYGFDRWLPLPCHVIADDAVRRLVVLVAHLGKDSHGAEGWHLVCECPDPMRRKPRSDETETWCVEELVIQLEAPAMPFPRTPGAPEVQRASDS